MRERPPIVFVTPYYPPFGAGGAEFTASLHARLLVERGQPVVVVTPNYGGAPREAVDGVEIVRHELVSLGRAGQQAAARRFASPLYHRRLADEVILALGGRRPLCIHAQHQFMAHGAAAAAARLSAPFVAHLRDTSQICGLGALCLLEVGNDRPPPSCGLYQHLVCHETRFAPTYLAGVSPLGRKLRLASTAAGYLDWRRRRSAYRRAVRVAFASDGMRLLYETLPEFARTDRNFVAYAPILPVVPGEIVPALLPEPVRRARAAGQAAVVFVGKVSRGKGCDVMFEAWNRLAADLPDAKLFVAGNIDPSAWNIDPARTELLGFIARDAVPALYDAADLVLLPSTWPEPLGWSTLDAARHGRPIVATSVGGVPEAVLDGETGRLVPRLDPAAMAAAIRDVLDRPDRGRSLGVHARQRIEARFGPAAVGRQLDALYAGLEEHVHA